ncbi:MAG TPA: phosphate/phosphite/phosphonate ABC transporter substrate-binding protein [Candidatus Deferrimicrobiaceae bacterium]
MKRFAATVAVSCMVGLSSLPGLAQAAGKPVAFAVVAGDSVKGTVEKFQPLMDYLSKKTGNPFELKAVKDYQAIVDGFKSGEYEAGIIGSGVGGAAVRDIGAIPVVRPVTRGVSTYRGYLITRKDSGMKKIEDFKGKSFDFGRKGNSAGHLYPLSLLKAKKLDPDTFFSKVEFTPKHEVVISKVLNREVAGGSVKDASYEKLKKEDPRIATELVVLSKSESFPDMTHFFRKGASAELVKATRKALLGIDRDPAGKAALAALGAEKYVETTAKDFAYVQKLLKAAGI